MPKKSTPAKAVAQRTIRTALPLLADAILTANDCPVKNARFLTWLDVFEVEFDDGFCLRKPHAGIRKANRITPSASLVRVELESGLRRGFHVHYDNGQTAVISGASIRERPGRQEGNPKSALSR